LIVKSIDEVMVDLWAQGRGFLGENDDPTKRIAKPILYARDETDTLSYGYGRPIEGLTPVIDLNKKEIIEIEDLGTLWTTEIILEILLWQCWSRR
jgi:primary-amine oxidase